MGTGECGSCFFSNLHVWLAGASMLLRLTRFCFLPSSELAREKMWSRIHLIPMLQAEEDRDLVRRTWADKARERELMGSETRVYHSDRCVSGECPPSFSYLGGEGKGGELDAFGSNSCDEDSWMTGLLLNIAHLLTSLRFLQIRSPYVFHLTFARHEIGPKAPWTEMVEFDSV